MARRRTREGGQQLFHRTEAGRVENQRAALRACRGPLRFGQPHRYQGLRNRRKSRIRFARGAGGGCVEAEASFSGRGGHVRKRTPKLPRGRSERTDGAAEGLRGVARRTAKNHARRIRDRSGWIGWIQNWAARSGRNAGGRSIFEREVRDVSRRFGE